ncbi:hypothetical protein A7U43_03410 [Mycobacterium adipatum]|uniref:Cardiolipin synthase N-terminal domain-containing protein n=1 Tax=Mycobacterium adipatum TaxID=1682113 RepID=A0A172UHV6_9MYCO|nr:PLD nuclease N-terminal domain-containing protein [Mycobacterium adipatum]ANE78510.1 hypothetical protein A7U43_03410 [Mycobacterium adipatum]
MFDTVPAEPDDDAGVIAVEEVVVCAAALLWTWAIGDVMAVDHQPLRPGEKAAWIAAVMLLPAAGALMWLLVGRPATHTEEAPATHPVSPRPDVHRK